MEKQNQESKPLKQSSDRNSEFRIPKKKADDWSEDVHLSSPLSRLSEPSYKNVTVRKRPWDSSYDSFNKTRNKDSNAYYQSKFPPFRSSRSELRGVHNEAKSPSEEVPYDFKAKRCSVELIRIQEPFLQSKACRDVSNTSNSSQKEANMSNSRRRSYCDQSESSRKEAEQQKKSPVNMISSPSKSKRDRTYCQKRAEQMQSKAHLLPQEDSICVNALSVEENLQLSTGTPDIGRTTSSKSNNGTTLTDDIFDSCNFDEHSSNNLQVLSKRNVKTRHSHKETPSSLEPIVLSSDEEERNNVKTTEPVNVSVIENPLIDVNEGTAQDEASKLTKHFVLAEKETLLSRQTENQVLDLEFMNAYIGKKKGRATGPAKFTAKSINIPLRVSTSKLCKYGVWETDKDYVRSRAIIFLWVSSDYVQHIETQLGTSSRDAVSISIELIFLELNAIPSKKELDVLHEIMKEASNKGSPGLKDIMSWQMACPLLKDLPPTENAFMLNCLSAFQKQQPHLPETQALPEPSSECSSNKHTPNTYTLLQRQRGGIYSASLVPKQDNGWTEMKHAGSLLRLIVYPPPPTKGGLCVTNEDLDCLEHGEFLNDVIIDFYLKYLLLEKFPKPFAERSHIFSSFFYKCLTRKEIGANESITALPAAQRRHQRVKTWTRHVDIFTKDFIFVPVNENSHWYLAVICFPWLESAEYEERKELHSTSLYCKPPKETSNRGSVIVFNDRLEKEEDTIFDDSSSDDSNRLSPHSGSNQNHKSQEPKRNPCRKVCKRPCLLIFDSLKTASVQTTVQVLREYLKVEWEVKRKTTREFSRSNFRELYPKVPKQNNSTDCGLFLLQYVESFVQKPIENFDSPIHLKDWFPLTVVKCKREEIRDLILKLHLQQDGNSGKKC
ncbi:SUMO specific peptidase 7 L homeolog isoform X2 [Xenopus laevis]|uniref:SUMO specific peptidase 7 L homeolog isoform X2 n=1 Tax=Xenopus laevis TaxID=8355 RepID=A0A8J0UBC6_XENLA|nr:SUMO specific peptidase 7 L homeolog isoform X2 [Xenopus laevis]